MKKAEDTAADKLRRAGLDAQTVKSLIEGYKEMSRINLSLAESALESDNEALALGEQKLAECE